MKANLSALLLASAFASMPACAGGGVPAEPPATPSGVTAAQPANNAGRPLDLTECKSLGQWLADACENRPNERSARVEGWCSDVLRGVESGAWITADCVPHIKYIDSTCFRSTTSVHDLMACDVSVSRP
jgi:hypothetical protein